MKRILVSGGNGFLGKHLVNKALNEGFSVTVVDNLSTSKNVQLEKDVVFIKKDVEGFSDGMPYDYVIHLAARPSPDDYIQNPVETLTSNSIGTLRMLEVAKKSNAIFMYTSSSEVYGNPEVLPTPESYFGIVNSIGDRSCYDEGKRFSEALIMAYQRQYNLDTRIQRPFNVYGPGIREDGVYGRVVPRFITWALKNEPITVHGTGRQTRSFLYVKDWVEASWKLMLTPGISGQVINIGAADEISMIDLALMIKQKAGSYSKIVFQEKRSEDPLRRAADISKALKLLNWKPKVSLNEGLEITIQWFKEMRS